MPTLANIESEARLLVDADTTSYTAADLLRRENAAYESIVALILGCDGLWQFDDSRYTDIPVGTTTLVNAQQDYSFDTSHLEVERVEVKDNSGIWHELNPIDKSQIGGALSEYQNVPGLPYEYDKQGASIFLYPAPATGSVTMASGLKVYFKRTASVFTSGEQSAGTAIPGFASPFHYLISYKAALPYAQSYKPQRVPMLVNEIAKLEKELVEFYSQREKDRRKVISMGGVSFR